MINKAINKEKALLVRNITEKYGLMDQLAELDNFIARNEEYKAHILMLGGYSAGKSALLNKYIGKKVLKENQGPETDIAVELYFSEKEHIVANMLSGSKQEISDIEQINIEETRNIEYYLNSENLKTQSDYIMVDTPGFDSGIEKHNKALMQYVDRGTAFFLVIDCENGTISESTLKFINEVTNYSTDIAVIINKCDKKTDTEIEEIREHIEDLLLAWTGRSFPLICTSIYDDDVEKKMKQLIGGFNPQYLYDKTITSELKRREDEIVQALEVLKEKTTCNTEEIEEEIVKRENARKRLLEQINLQKKRLGTKLHNEIKEQIVSNVYSQLMCNAESLASAYKGGIELFQERVIEIIRPVMISEIENYSSLAYEDFIKHLNYKDIDVLNNSDEITEVVESVYEKLIELSKDGAISVPVVHESDNTNLADSAMKTYRAVSSILAIATDAVAPPLELLIVFLPDIIKLLGVLTGNTKEQQLVEVIQNKIIPQIVAKVRTELDKSLNEVESVMLVDISANVEEILNIENEALEVAKNKKSETESTYSEFISSIDEDIAAIRK